MTRTRKIGAGLALLALAGCAEAVESRPTDPPKAADVVETTEAPPPPTRAPDETGDAKSFATALMVRSDLIDEGTDAFSDISDLVEDFDLVGASARSREGARTFGQLHDYAQGLPGADSNVGRASIGAFATCRDSLMTASNALSSFDPAQLETSIDRLQDCTAAMDRATDIVLAET